MCSAVAKFTVAHLSDYQIIKNVLTSRWIALENMPNTFRYKLNVRQQRTLDGHYGFFVQVRIMSTKLAFITVHQTLFILSAEHRANIITSSPAEYYIIIA